MKVILGIMLFVISVETLAQVRGDLVVAGSTYSLYDESVRYWVNNEGQFVIQGPTLTLKKEWANFMTYPKFYDRSMPLVCSGQFNGNSLVWLKKLIEVFHSEAVCNVAESLRCTTNQSGEEVCEVIVLKNHQPEFDLTVKTSSCDAHYAPVYLDDDRKILADLANQLLALFHDVGLNPFEWNPRTASLYNFQCDWEPGLEPDL